MVEGLDTIDWASLEHAYESAEDVPDCLRGLTSEDEEIRKGALCQLYGNIWHQGTVYEATSYAVPFLLELLPEVQGKDELLLFLYDLATGWNVNQFLSGNEAKRGIPEFEAELALEEQWVEAAHAAVRQGVPLYLQFLRAGTTEERTNAAYLLSAFIREDARVEETVKEQLQSEAEPNVRAMLLFCLGEAKGDADTCALCEAHLQDEDEFVRFAAAVALTSLKGENVPDAVPSILLNVAQHPQTIDEQYQDTPWSQQHNTGWLVGVACAYLAQTGARAAPFAPALPDLLRQTPKADQPEVAKAALRLIFGPVAELPLPATPTLRALSDLTPLQHDLLLAIVESCRSEKRISRGIEVIDGNLIDRIRDLNALLARYGLPPMSDGFLPSSRDELRPFLGLPPQERKW